MEKENHPRSTYEKKNLCHFGEFMPMAQCVEKKMIMWSLTFLGRNSFAMLNKVYEEIDHLKGNKVRLDLPIK